MKQLTTYEKISLKSPIEPTILAIGGSLFLRLIIHEGLHAAVVKIHKLSN